MPNFSANSRGLGFAMPIMGLNAYGERFASHSKNLAAAGAVAGREFETFLTSFSIHEQINGVEFTTLRHLDAVGTPIDSKVATNFSIVGSGFVPVNNVLTSTTNLGFTRDATFAPDQDTYLVNGKGEYLLAFAVNPDGTPVKSDVTTLTNLKPVKLNTFQASPQATANVTMALQLPAEAADGYTKNETLNVYDSLGNIRSLRLVWEKVPQAGPFAPGATQAWKLTVQDPNGVAAIGEPYQSGLRIDYDVHGVPVTYGGTAGFGGAIALGTTTAPNLGVAWGNPPADSNIAMNLGVAGTNTGVVSEGDTYAYKNITYDGAAPGKFVNFEFDQFGYGIAHFDNNTQVKVCQIPLANFNNINGLTEIRSSVFGPTMESGEYQLFFPSEGNVGFLKPFAYEGSTSSSTAVYVRMIEDQKRFIGNVKTIEVGSEMYDALDGIIR